MTADHSDDADERLAVARRLAAVVLPSIDDLGRGWEPDDGEPADEATRAYGTPDDCLPADFPDGARLADAEVAFTRPGHALVVALSSVFAERRSAAEAWRALAADDFVRCFAATIATEVEAGATVELLGPVVSAGDLVVERGGVRVERHRAAFAGAGESGLTPAVLHLAVLVAGRAVVVLWGVDPGTTADDGAFEHLVARVTARADAALAEPS